MLVELSVVEQRDHVMQDRRFTTLDEAEVMDRVAEIARRMVRKAGRARARANADVPLRAIRVKE